MQLTVKQALFGIGVAVLSLSSLPGCSKVENREPAATTSSQGTVPAPPGDATPKPADSNTRQAQEGNEKTGASGPQSTVGTAAAGAPPYTLNGAPEGNAAPKSGEPVKK